MTWVLFTVYGSLHAAFIWARFAVFRIDGPVPRGVRLIEVSSSASLLIGAVLIATRPAAASWRDLPAVVAGALSAGLFAWALRTVRPRQLTAAFSTDVPVELLRRGAFAFVRNPFYLAYMIAHTLPFAATRSVWSLPAAVGMCAVYTWAAVLEERKFLASPWAEDFGDYMAETGRFFPRIPRWAGGSR